MADYFRTKDKVKETIATMIRQGDYRSMYSIYLVCSKSNIPLKILQFFDPQVYTLLKMAIRI